jgi:arylsulfatase A-like enzyme
MSSPGSGNRNDAVPRGLVTLTELLNEAGYRTLAVTGGGYMGKSFGQDQGFEHFFVDNPSSGVFHRKTGIEWQVGKVLEALGDAGLDDGRPIFAFLHTYEIHSPYESKPPFEDLYGHYDSRFVPTSENLKAARQRGLKTLEDQDLAAIEAAYDRGIRYTDEWLKQLIAGLRASGFLDDSLIVISADHGEEFGEHGALLHPVSLFDELLHVPLIMVGPGVPVAVSDPRMVSTVDVAPTILSLVGVDVPSFMQGRALFESDDEWHEDQAVFSQYRRVLYSVRTARWKLIKRRGAAPKLFDLRFDPRERKDMAKGHRDVVAELSTRLEEWRRRQPTLKDLERSTAELSEEEEQQLRALGYN